MRRLLPCLLLLAACAPVPQEDATTANAVTSGSNDYNTDAVIVVTANGFGASAVVVGPNLLVTAAHAVHPAFTDGQASSVGLSYGARFDLDSDVTLPFSKVHIHPAFDPQHVSAGHDIAVIELGSAHGVTPLALARAPLTTAIVNAPVRVVGFGGTDTRFELASGDQRKYAMTIVESATEQLLVVGGNDSSQACVGDSGGPALRKRADGSEEIVALASFVTAQDTHCQHGNYSTRIDANMDFLAPFLPPAPADPTPDPAPADPTPDPSPPTDGGTPAPTP